MTELDDESDHSNCKIDGNYQDTLNTDDDRASYISEDCGDNDDSDKDAEYSPGK